MGNVFHKHFFRQLFQTIYARFNVRLERFTHEFNTAVQSNITSSVFAK